MNKISPHILTLSFLLFFNCSGFLENQPEPKNSIFSQNFIFNKSWDDGKAEISIYTIEERTNDNVKTSKFVRTLVKHRFDTLTMKKPSEGTADNSHPEVLLWGQFNRSNLESSTINRSVFVTALRNSFDPIKQTIGEQSLEGNTLIESRYFKNKVVEIFTGDLYTEPIDTFLVKPRHYPIMQLPLIIRALSFDSVRFHSIAFDLPHYDLPELLRMIYGRTAVTVDLEKTGEEILDLNGQSYNADRIEVLFKDKGHVYPPIYHQGEMPDKEIYWRMTSFPNTILKQTATFSNDQKQVEVVLDTTYRSAWWK